MMDDVGGSYSQAPDGLTNSLSQGALVQRADDAGCCSRTFGSLIEKVSAPIEWLCNLSIPHEPEEGEDSTMWFGVIQIGWENSWYMLGFVVSLCYVAILSDLILVFAKFCCDTIGMSEDLEGVTVLAWGAQRRHRSRR